MSRELVYAADAPALAARDSTEVPYLQFPALAALSGLTHGVFTRAGGASEPPYATLNVSLAVGDDPAQVRENRRRIAVALGADPSQVFGARQVHGAAWRVIAPGAVAITERLPCDILLSGTPANCCSSVCGLHALVLWDARRRWVAVAHAGWRGTAQDVPVPAVRGARARRE